MKILVAYATRHGATRGIAERIAETLGRRGMLVTLAAFEDLVGPGDYDAYVLGSATYAFHWQRDATAFVRRNKEHLQTKPAWLFSSGPLGTETTDENGHDVRQQAAPREIPDLREAINARDAKVFFGAYDANAKPVGLLEHLSKLVPAGRSAFADGDFRDWDEIDAWAERIANQLTPAPAGSH